MLFYEAVYSTESTGSPKKCGMKKKSFCIISQGVLRYLLYKKFANEKAKVPWRLE